jgi:alginate O-acetyltransferase complex protein AlgI
MIFSSQIFLLYFLPLTLGVYYLLPVRWRNLFLTLSSYVFYGWWKPWFVVLQLASTAIDWHCGAAIARPGATPRARKTALMVSILSNLSILGYFKYYMFTMENVNWVIEHFGGAAVPVMQVTLPLGISFYTLQSMSYTIDIYRGDAERAKSRLDFACFVAMFPQIVIGPIVRYSQIQEQLHDRPQKGELFRDGAALFMVGFAKKTLVANTLGEVADVAFAAEHLPAHVAWWGIVAYSYQLYYDFSGYSDMAIGLGYMLGFKLPWNFKSPLRATSFTDLWRRWHMSLSFYLRDYIYFPLGGSRRGYWVTIYALFVTFFLCGVWHGAMWHYVVFGVIHGALIVGEKVTGRESLWPFLPRPLQSAMLFLCWTLTMNVFRDQSMVEVGEYFTAMLFGQGDPVAGTLTAGWVYQPVFVAMMLLTSVLTFACPSSNDLVKRAASSWPLSLWILAVFVLAVVAMFTQAENPFIYFQF